MRKLLLTAVFAVLSLPAALAGEAYTATATGNLDGNKKSVRATITIDRFSTQAEKGKARTALDSDPVMAKRADVFSRACSRFFTLQVEARSSSGVTSSGSRIEVTRMR